MILKMENTKKRKRGDFAGDISIIRKKERFSNFSKCWVKEKLVFFWISYKGDRRVSGISSEDINGTSKVCKVSIKV